ncbi:helicase RepA family protein [Methylobacterium oxalidis]|uniref:helicase RepA family protein n=1 Tax=Methylobacterium oxalidis TaxID=944322 RepID=UPI00331512B7
MRAETGRFSGHLSELHNMEAEHDGGLDPANVHPFGRRPFASMEDNEPAGFDRFDREQEERQRIIATPFVLADPTKIPPRRWLYGRHFIRRYPTTTIAPGGLGKTSLVLVEALAMVTGLPLLGVAVPERLRVWVWNGEDPREEIERRLAAACLHCRIKPEQIAGRLFIDSGRDLPIKIAARQRDATTVSQSVVDDLVHEIRERRIDLLIIDPFVACHDVPENDNSAVDRVAKAWAGVAEAGNCGVELVHHVRKPGAGQASYSVEDARGGSALIGAVRSARVLNGMSQEEASQAGIEAEKRRRYFRVDDGKANMQPPADRAAWHQLVSVPLGNDTPDAPGDFIGVVASWSLPGLLDQITMEQVRAIQAEVDAGDWAESSQAGNWVGRAVASVLRMDPDDKADAAKIKRYLRTWFEGGALRKVSNYDPKKGRNRTAVIVGERV